MSYNFIANSEQGWWVYKYYHPNTPIEEGLGRLEEIVDVADFSRVGCLPFKNVHLKLMSRILIL